MEKSLGQLAYERFEQITEAVDPRGEWWKFTFFCWEDLLPWQRDAWEHMAAFVVEASTVVQEQN